jgi:molecular chaperone GrpE
MPGKKEKGAISADIPSDAIEEALRSVERHAGGEVEIEAGPEGGEAGPSVEALAAEKDSLAAQLEMSLAKGRETMERLREEHDRYLRAAADLDNYRKRAQKEREDVQKFGVERLLKDLIPILDNLERALQAAAADDPLSGGVRLVLRTLEETLGRHGVKGFSALGQPFDPRLHEALMQVATSDRPAGTVVLEHGRGFLLNDRLVRPAMVGVAIPPAQGETAPTEAASPGGRTAGAEGPSGDGEAGGQQQ